MTDIKLLLTTLIAKFEALANEAHSINGEQWYDGKEYAYANCARELREALAVEETVQRELAHTPVEPDPFIKGFFNDECKRRLTPSPTNNEIVGIVAATRYYFNSWAIGQAEEHGGVYNINHGTVRLPNGKKYVYMDRIERLRGIELSSFEELPNANRHPYYSELMNFLPSRVRRQVTK